MKKQAIKIGLLSLLAIGSITTLNSCRDAIYIEQDGLANEDNFFTSVNNLQKFLYGDVYKSLDNTTGIYASSILTDEVRIGSSNGGQGLESFRHFLDANNPLARTIWVDNYYTINRATRLIEGAQKITPVNSTETASYNQILAEARAIRALAYLQLETFFSEDMTNDDALGVIILNEVPKVSTKLPRSKNSEVFAAIEADLNFAEQYLPQSSRYFASKDLVNAIRARLNLYRGRYTQAKTYAEAVINNSGLSLTTATPVPSGIVGSTDWNDAFYADASTSPYRQIWSDNAQGEVVFALSRPVIGTYKNIGAYYNTNNSTTGGNPLWEMGRNLFNLLDAEKNTDIRRYAYIDPTSVIDTNYLNSTNRTSDQLVIDKYPGKGTNPTRNDLKLFRLSEMYLIIAEAEAEAGNLAAAATNVASIKTARAYSGTPATPVYASKQDALAGILAERRLELAFEGHRYIDLKRMATRAGVTMDRNKTDDNIGVTVNNLNNGSYKYTLPIPASEIAGNNNIQQNTGY